MAAALGVAQGAVQMKSLAQKIRQCAGLCGTSDVNVATANFLASMEAKLDAAHGRTEWMTDAQIKWLEDVYERHFA